MVGWNESGRKRLWTERQTASECLKGLGKTA